MNGQEEKSGGLCEKQVRRILRRMTKIMEVFRKTG